MLRRVGLLSLGLGAGLMYVLDPQMGKRRRAVARDTMMHWGRKASSAASVAARDAMNRASGIVAEVRSSRSGEPVSDAVLVERVRAQIGTIVGHPGSIEVAAERGRRDLARAHADEHGVSTTHRCRYAGECRQWSEASGVMRYLALACDYDGTLAAGGRVAQETLAALTRLLASGRQLILVTGTEVPNGGPGAIPTGSGATYGCPQPAHRPPYGSTPGTPDTGLAPPPLGWACRGVGLGRVRGRHTGMPRVFARLLRLGFQRRDTGAQALYLRPHRHPEGILV